MKTYHKRDNNELKSRKNETNIPIQHEQSIQLVEHHTLFTTQAYVVQINNVSLKYKPSVLVVYPLCSNLGPETTTSTMHAITHIHHLGIGIAATV